MSKRWIRPRPHPHPKPHQHGLHLRRSQSRPRRRHRRSRPPKRTTRLHPAFPPHHHPSRARLAGGTALTPFPVIPTPRESMATIRRARPRPRPSLHHLKPLHFRNHPPLSFVRETKTRLTRQPEPRTRPVQSRFSVGLPQRTCARCPPTRFQKLRPPSHFLPRRSLPLLG